MKLDKNTLDFNLKTEIIPNLISCILVLVFVFGFMGVGGYSDTHYTTKGEVYEIDDNKVILLENNTEYLWAVVDREDLELGQKVQIKFFNNTTDSTRKDDTIVDVRVIP